MSRAVWAGLLVAGVIGFQAGIYSLSTIGTCASGGPYVIENECPGGTGAWVALLIVSSLVIAVAGVGAGPIFGEERTWWRRRGGLVPALAFVPFTFECAAWSVLTALVILAGTFAPWSDASAGAREGSAIVAGVLLVGGPGCWMVARLLLRAADRGPRET